jgi:hypothetical protein
MPGRSEIEIRPAFISIATSCHQAWSANMFTVASDAFPNRAVGSVVGFGGIASEHAGEAVVRSSERYLSGIRAVERLDEADSNSLRSAGRDSHRVKG